MNNEYSFTFGGVLSRVCIQYELPPVERVIGAGKGLLVCDTRTKALAEGMARGGAVPCCVLPPGESAKTWDSAEAVLKAAKDAGLTREGVFIGLGGGVIGDLTGFAASVYMRGARLCLVPSTLLAMVDAAVGGKTGFDLFGVKNFAGSFYPASHVYMASAVLRSLPAREWKSGAAELIKTAVLDTAGGLMEALMRGALAPLARGVPPSADTLQDLIARSVLIKGRIAESDPHETTGQRALLNLGHTFGHALESCAGFGALSHGEAVAWGMARACDLGLALGKTPRSRARELTGLIESLGYETAAPHPLARDVEAFLKVMAGDKKRNDRGLRLVVPSETGAVIVSSETSLLARIIGGR
ncbi:MAG: 3-dehydroquinate synthase [Spirochaetaceae bacterium]|jgi:3-dehydroquinate synthase|nr:3-dehydroquinate synthase [Spirochaetaceae bacterium]